MEGSLGNFRTVESDIGEEQTCFSRGRCMVELMFALRQLVEKRPEGNKSLGFNSLII